MPSTLAGRATADATEAFARRHADLGPHAHGSLGQTGLTVSRAGFGCYRVHHRSREHAAAMRAALSGGINLIDTSTNYTDGGSERLVGQVLREMVEEGVVRREEIVIVTKTGYMQGENHELASRREEEGRAFPEVVKLGPDLWHCIHPEFLEDQITRSLERLGLETIDVFLLHNPEYFLEHARMGGATIDAARDEYHRRVEEAFRHLETEVSRGRIVCHGISSNTFVEPAHDPKFTSLERCVASAARVNAAHHFRVIQMPGNMVEAGLCREHNQRGGTATVLDVAAELGLGVLVNRPLNAFTGQEMVRLAEYPLGSDGTPEAVRAQVESVVALERELQGVLPESAHGTHEAPGPLKLLIAGGFMQQNWPAFQARDHWQEFAAHRLIPQVQHGLAMLAEVTQDPAVIETWQSRYVEAVNRAVVLLHDLLTAEDGRRAGAFRAELVPHLPEHARALPLSQLAVWAVASLPAVSCVLVGMRRVGYVDDVLAALRVSQEGSAGLWKRL